MQTLYRFFDAEDNLLYIGITMAFRERWSQHRRDKEWIDEITTIRLEQYETREELLQAEENAIRQEQPRYNVIHNSAKKRELDLIGERLDDDALLAGQAWFQRHPKLMALFTDFWKLFDRYDIYGIDDHDWISFTQHIEAGIDLRDRCRDCGLAIDGEILLTRFAPIVVMPNGQAFYGCDKGHTWNCWWKAAQGKALPKMKAEIRL